jgi:hypothetical protein
VFGLCDCVSFIRKDHELRRHSERLQGVPELVPLRVGVFTRVMKVNGYFRDGSALRGSSSQPCTSNASLVQCRFRASPHIGWTDAFTDVILGTMVRVYT